MSKSKLSDNAFAFVGKVGDKDFRLLRYRDENGEVNENLLSFSLQMVDYLPASDEEKLKAKKTLTDAEAEVIFKTDASFDRYATKAEYKAFRCRLSGEQEAPERVNTEAQGKGRFIYRLIGRTLFYDVRFQGLSSPETASHFHIGPSDEPGPIEIPVPVGNPKFGSVVLTEEQEDALFAGLMFFNVHSQNFPPGEIRGQLFPHSELIHKHMVSSKKVDAGEKLDRCVESVMEQRIAEFREEKGRSPNKEERQEIESSAFAICRSQIDEESDNRKHTDKKRDKKKKKRSSYTESEKSENTTVQVDLDVENKLIREGNKPVAQPKNDKTIEVGGDQPKKKVLLSDEVTIEGKKIVFQPSFSSDISDDKKKKLEENISNFIYNSILEDSNDALDENEICGLKAQLVEVKEEGSMKIFSVQVGDPDFPITLHFEVAFDGEENPVAVHFLNGAFPAEVLDDVVKFLESIKKL